MRASRSAHAPIHRHRRSVVTIFILLLLSITVTSAKRRFTFNYSMPPFQPTSDTNNMAVHQRRGNKSSSSPGVLSQRGGDGGIKSNKHVTVTTASSTTAGWRRKLRDALFPIYGDEVIKFLLIGSIKFFVILALTLTRDNKDTMVVTECGAEAIAFLKVSGFTLPYHVLIVQRLGCSHKHIFSDDLEHCDLFMYTDIWCIAECSAIHRILLENIKHTSQEDAILHHMRTILCILLPIRCNHISQSRGYTTIVASCAILPWYFWINLLGRNNDICKTICQLDVSIILHCCRGIFLGICWDIILAICQWCSVDITSETVLPTIRTDVWISTHCGWTVCRTVC